MKAIWVQLMVRLIGIAWGVEPHLVLILGAQQPTVAEPKFSACSWSEGEITRIANQKRVVNLSLADQHFAIGPESSPFKNEDSGPNEIAALGRVLKSTKGHETRIELEAKVPIQVVIDECPYALQPLSALVRE